MCPVISYKIYVHDIVLFHDADILYILFFFFFYYSAPPRNLPSSPPRPSPDPAPRQQPFQSAEPLGDPMIVPCLDRRFVLPKRPKQVAEHPEIVDRMNVASDHCRQCPHP